MRHPKQSSGFVLILALMVLVVAATVLTASARRVSSLALRAGAQQQEVQVRWGAESCQALCLSRAEAWLALPEGDEPVVSRSVDLKLGGIAFRVIVSDEQAKANVNRLWVLRGDSGVMAAVQHLQVGNTRPLQPRVQPDPTYLPGAAALLPFSSFEQVAAASRPSQLIDPAGSASLAGRMTLWGSGRINLRRAEPRVIREALDGILMEDEIAGVLMRRKLTPGAGLDVLLDETHIPRPRLVLVRQAVTDASQCHSAWVIARGATREWHRFYVAQEGPSANGPLRWRFTW